MKLLFTLIPAFNPNEGGVQRTTYKLGKYFTEKGIDVHYFSLTHQGHIKATFGTLHSVNQLGGSNNPENIETLEKVIDQVKPDIVINQMPYEVPLRQSLSRKKQELGFLLLGCLRNALFSVKNNLSQYAKETLPSALQLIFDNPLGHILLLQYHKQKHSRELRKILDQHDHFILLTPPNREELRYFVGDYCSDKVLAIPNSIPEVNTDPLQKEKIILHVGRLNIPQKRSDLLLEVWKKIHSFLPDWQFLVVGDGPYKSTMERQIKKWELPRVSLEGFQKPESYYKRAAIFLMTSAYEGFPNVLLEAQSFGVVPVAFDNYIALSWIVEDERNALLIPPFDTGYMGEGIIQLANNQDVLRELVQAALENAEKFTIEKVGQKWLEFFKARGVNV